MKSNTQMWTIQKKVQNTLNYKCFETKNRENIWKKGFFYVIRYSVSIVHDIKTSNPDI